MQPPGFINKLNRRIDTIGSLLCVGLDPDITKLPDGMSQFEFNKTIIKATYNFVCAYKPNPAFYEAVGAEGVAALKQTCDFLHDQYPHIPIIIDSKRGDIGNSNRGYEAYVFDYLGADALTVPPYMGQESLRVFLDRPEIGVLVLCRTSNPGAGEFQDLESNGEPLYLTVAKRVAGHWNKLGNCMLVVGATYPDQLKTIRAAIGPDMPILMPGSGSQGGIISQAVPAGIGSNRRGLIINSSREVIFSGLKTNIGAEARNTAHRLRDEINAAIPG
jgi:orotidine-5'-phosphate decarboxylase